MICSNFFTTFSLSMSFGATVSMWAELQIMMKAGSIASWKMVYLLFYASCDNLNGEEIAYLFLSHTYPWEDKFIRQIKQELVVYHSPHVQCRWEGMSLARLRQRMPVGVLPQCRFQRGQTTRARTVLCLKWNWGRSGWDLLFTEMVRQFK